MEAALKAGINLNLITEINLTNLAEFSAILYPNCEYFALEEETAHRFLSGDLKYCNNLRKLLALGSATPYTIEKAFHSAVTLLLSKKASSVFTTVRACTCSDSVIAVQFIELLLMLHQFNSGVKDIQVPPLLSVITACRKAPAKITVIPFTPVTPLPVH